MDEKTEAQRSHASLYWNPAWHQGVLLTLVVHLLLLCLQHLPPIQVPCIHILISEPPPQSPCAVTHMRKGLKSDSSVLVRFSEIGIKKKCPLSW